MTESALKKHLAKIGAKGGRTKGASKARSSEQASAAVRARWAKAKRKAKK